MWVKILTNTRQAVPNALGSKWIKDSSKTENGSSSCKGEQNIRRQMVIESDTHVAKIQRLAKAWMVSMEA